MILKFIYIKIQLLKLKNKNVTKSEYITWFADCMKNEPEEFIVKFAKEDLLVSPDIASVISRESKHRNIDEIEKRIMDSKK